jgi:hypothetical protein
MTSAAVRATLDELIRSRGDDYASVSRLLGRNAAYVQQFIKRGVPRRLSEEDRRRLAAHFGVSERLLGAPVPLAGPVEPADPAAGDLVLVPRYDLGASAGPGALTDEDVAASALPFQAAVARGLASGRVEALSTIRVAGDSMHPTLSDGDEIVVDAADAAGRLRDGIYVLRVDGALLVKRLAVNPASRRLDILSDNPAYPGWHGCDPDGVAIIGRVVWVGRRLA